MDTKKYSRYVTVGKSPELLSSSGDFFVSRNYVAKAARRRWVF